MPKRIVRILFPAVLLVSPMISELPASTFGGSTGPRQGQNDAMLPRIAVDKSIYRRTKARLSVEDVAPLVLPSGSYTVKKFEDDEIVEYNQTFLVIPRD